MACRDKAVRTIRLAQPLDLLRLASRGLLCRIPDPMDTQVAIPACPGASPRVVPDFAALASRNSMPCFRQAETTSLSPSMASPCSLPKRSMPGHGSWNRSRCRRRPASQRASDEFLFQQRAWHRLPRRAGAIGVHIPAITCSPCSDEFQGRSTTRSVALTTIRRSGYGAV